MLMIDMEMPKSCDICPFMKTNDDLMSNDYRYMYCDYPYMGEYVSDYTVSRHPDCPLMEVVKCEDCEYDCEYHSYDSDYGYDWCNRTSGVFRVKPDDFCSKGKRREE